MPKLIIDTDELYDINEVANILNKGVATIWRWIRDERVIPIRVAGRTLIPKSEIERLKNDRNKKTTQAASG